MDAFTRLSGSGQWSGTGSILSGQNGLDKGLP